MQRILALAIFVSITACAGKDGALSVSEPAGEASGDTPSDDAVKAKAAESEPASGDDEREDESEGPSVDSETLESKIVETDINAEPTNVGEEISAGSTGLPLEMNEAVGRWIEYFTVRDPERFRRFLERGEKYRGMITAVLKEQGVPTEVYFLAMIESGFMTTATSHAKAVGIWQFMKGTAKRYGLRVDDYVDERRDPMRATAAAALYLKDLHNVFQSWYLAMAAYNAGEGRIVGAIMRAKTRDFWEIAELRALPAETMEYIPKFLAATTIGHNLRKYGLDDINPEVRPVVAPVSVPSPIRLSDLASVTGLDLAMLKELNPHLLKATTPPGVSHYRVWVPRDLVAQVEMQEEKLAEHRLRGLRATEVADKRSGSRRPRGAASGGSEPPLLDAEGDLPQYHKVTRGETLAKIAEKYGTTIKSLRSLNKIRGNRIATGTRLLVAAKPASTPQSARTASGKGPTPKVAVKRYRVQRGDSLDGIAKRFKMSVGDLKRLNRLNKNRIYAGQVLKIPEGEG
jgi:membrane-bound lytic murein transglycosylase D